MLLFKNHSRFYFSIGRKTVTKFCEQAFVPGIEKPALLASKFKQKRYWMGAYVVWSTFKCNWYNYICTCLTRVWFWLQDDLFCNLHRDGFSGLYSGGRGAQVCILHIFEFWWKETFSHQIECYLCWRRTCDFIFYLKKNWHIFFSPAQAPCFSSSTFS